MLRHRRLCLIVFVTQEKLRPVTNNWTTKGQPSLSAREWRLATRIEKVPGIQSRISEQRKQVSVIFPAAILRDRVDLGSEIATKLCIPKQSRNRNLFDRLNRLGNQSDEALTTDAHIRIIVVRPIY